MIAKEGGWKCKCGKSFRTRAELNLHKKECEVYKNTKRSYEKRDQKFLRKCPFCGQEKLTTLAGLTIHMKYCKKNPEGVASPSNGREVSEETKQKISKTRKELIKEGKLFKWNIRRSEASYPEKWLMNVLKENFGLERDISYIKEFPFYGFYLDFAWPESKLCIEIDGEQHYTDDSQHKRDLKKDELLRQNNWTEMRVSWQYIMKNTQSFIKELDKFLKTKDDKITKESKVFIDQKLKASKEKKEAKEKLWSQRINLIKNSGIDLTKYGYIQALVRATGLTRKVVYETLEKMK